MLIDTTYFLKVLKRRIWLLIGIPLVVGVVTHFVIHNRPAQYRSIAQISAGLPITLTVASSKGKKVSPEQSNAVFLNHVEAMKTGFIGSMVSYKLLLHDLNEDVPFRENSQSFFSSNDRSAINGRLEEKLAAYETLSPYNELDSRLIEVLKKKNYDIAQWINEGILKIERMGDTNFIKVEFQSENPFLSAFVVNAMSTEYIRYSNAQSYTPNDSLQFLSNQLNKLKEDLEAKTEQLKQAEMESRSGMDLKVNYVNQIAEYEVQLRDEANQVNKLLTLLKTVRSKISAQGDHSKIRSMDPYKAPKVIELQSKIGELNNIYTTGGSKDERLKATINRLKNQLRDELARLEVELMTAKGKESAVVDLITEERKIESQYKQAELALLSTRIKIDKLRKESPVPMNELTALKVVQDQALKDYTDAKQKFDEVQNTTMQTKNGNGSLKLMVMGQPNAEPESFHEVTIVSITVAASESILLIILLLSTLIRAPRKPHTPTFVITR
jgi:succinoglycan biosynthesis transport protein ExoP